MRTLLLWSWAGNVLLLLYIFGTATNVFTTGIGQTALVWVTANTLVHYAVEPFYERR